MSTATMRFITPSGSFNSIEYSVSNSNLSGSAVSSSCNWDDNIYCDVTFTYDTGSMGADAKINSQIRIEKLVSYAAISASIDVSKVHSIRYI